MLDSSLLFWLKFTLMVMMIRVFYGEKYENAENIEGDLRGKGKF